MNLARHVAVLWRFRAVAVAGLLLGITLAVLATFELPSMKTRGAETWSAVSSILVTQPGFPEGRVTLPTKQTAIAGAAAPATPPARPNEVEFADPGRLASLADLYSRFLTSDDVLRRVPGRPTAAQVAASPFASSQGGLLLPVIQLTTTAPDRATAERLNRDVFASLRTLLSEQAVANGITDAKKVQVRFIDAPDTATLTAGRKYTGAILALLLSLAGTLALVHLLEGLRPRHQPRAGVVSVVDWDDTGTYYDADPHPASSHEPLASHGSVGRRAAG